MADKEVVTRLKVEGPTGDGFRKLSDEARKASADVKTRMKEVENSVKNIGKAGLDAGKKLQEGIKGSLGNAIGGGPLGSAVGGALGSFMPQGVGVGSMGFGLGAAWLGSQLLQAGLEPDAFIQQMRHGQGILPTVFRGAKVFKGLDESDAALKGQLQRHQQFRDLQKDFLVGAALRNPVEANQRAFANEMERLQLRGRMKGKKEPEIAVAEATLAREQAIRRIADLERQMHQTTEQDVGKRTNLATLLVTSQQELIAAEQKKLQAIEAQRRASIDRMEKERDHAKDQRQHYEDNLQQERDRINTGKEAFGLMDPMKRQAALQVSQKLKAGHDLSMEEIELAGGIDVFRDQLARYGRRKAHESGEFEQIVRNLGAEDRLKEAERLAKHFENIEIKIEEKIILELKQNEALVEQLAQTLAPEIMKMHQLLEQKLKQEFRMKDLASQSFPKT